MTLKTEIMAAEHSALPYRNILHFNIYIRKLLLLSKMFQFYCIFDHIKSAFVSIRHFFQNIKKI